MMWREWSWREILAPLNAALGPESCCSSIHSRSVYVTSNSYLSEPGKGRWLFGARPAAPAGAQARITSRRNLRHKKAAVYIGIDISKRELELARGGRSLHHPNDAPGISAVLRELRAVGTAHVVVEASGGYERAD